MFLVLPLSHEYFNQKRFTTFNPQVHSIYSQSYTQATSNMSQFLTLSILWTARQSASFFPCLCLDSDWWLDGDGLVSHRHRPVCMLLGSESTVSHRWRNSSYVRNMEQWYKPVLCKHRGRHTFWNVNILPSLGLLCYTDGQNNRGHTGCPISLGPLCFCYFLGF